MDRVDKKNAGIPEGEVTFVLDYEAPEGTGTDSGKVFERLVHLANQKNISVLFADLHAYDGRIKGNRLAVRSSLPGINEFNFILAHELAHAYLHYDKGDITETKEYEEEADRAAMLLLDAMKV